MSKIVTVRARQKSIDQLPSWALCCDAIRAIYARQGNLEVEVIPVAFLAEVECRYCHRIIRDVKYMRSVGWPDSRSFRANRHSAIPVECFEFDEGEITR